MQIEFETEELQFILNILGELPTKSNAYLLINKISEQVKRNAEIEDLIDAAS